MKEKDNTVVCLSIDTYDPGIRGACMTLGETLIDSGHKLIVEPDSYFIPRGMHATKEGPITLVGDVKPTYQHYEITKKLIDFGNVHISRSKALVRKVAASLTSSKCVFWTRANKDVSTDLIKILLIAKEQDVNTYDVAELTDFDKILRLGF